MRAEGFSFVKIELDFSLFLISGQGFFFVLHADELKWDHGEEENTSYQPTLFTGLFPIVQSSCSGGNGEGCEANFGELVGFGPVVDPIAKTLVAVPDFGINQAIVGNGATVQESKCIRKARLHVLPIDLRHV